MATSPTPPVASLRPSLATTLVRAFFLLLRNAVLCSLVCIFVAEPILARINTLPVVNTLDPLLSVIFLYSIMCHAVPWILINSCFGFMDSILPETGHSPLLRQFAPVRALGAHLVRYKLPRRPAQQPSRTLMAKTVIKGLVDCFLVAPVVTYLAGWGMDRATLPPVNRSVFDVLSPATMAASLLTNTSSVNNSWFSPTAQHQHTLNDVLRVMALVIPHFMRANLINEVGFFIAHATLHSHPWLYRTFHKQHHEYTGTISVAAEYAGVLEEVLANMLPTISYFAFFVFAVGNGHPSPRVQAARARAVLATWLWARLWETYESHSGFDFSTTWLGRIGLLNGVKARFHDFHHTHNVGNYGAGICMDGLFRTMDHFLMFEYARQNNKMLTGEEAAEEERKKKEKMNAAKKSG